MKRFSALLALAAGATIGIAQNNSGRPFTPPERLARWKRVEMPFHAEGLTARERQMVEKLVEACRLLDDVYLRQSDQAGLELYKTHRRCQPQTVAPDHGEPLGPA
jgi:hypothetical protein